MTKKTKAKPKKQEQPVQQPMENTGTDANTPISDDLDDLEAQPGNAIEGAPVLQAADQTEILEVSLGKTLRRKLFHLAAEEGIAAEELAQELIAEGVVLRAWEVIGRQKVQQGHTGGNQQNQQKQQNRGGNRKGRRHNKGRGGGGGGGGGGNWMEDKAAFLEYVRNQERVGRR